MWLVLGVPCLFWGHYPSQICGIVFHCLSWGLARSRLWQQGSGVFLGLGTALQVAEWKCLSHTGNWSISADGDGDRDHAVEDEP